MSTTVSLSGAPAVPVTTHIRQFDAYPVVAAATIDTPFATAPGATGSLFVPLDATTRAVSYFTTVSGPPGSAFHSGKIELYCGGQAPCQPDCGASDPRILALLTRIDNLAQLLQRYSLPFATIPGAAHSGQAGTGSFSVSRLIGMRVDITSHTTTRPDLEGNPAYVWDQGWMSILTGDGMIEEKRISQTHFEWLPKQMPLALTFGFELRPGTVATFTELQAEP
jgi:hypothetical protein